jgi:antitoxin CptB
MDLSDNDLLDLLLQRKAPQGHLAEEPALSVLHMLIKAGR